METVLVAPQYYTKSKLLFGTNVHNGINTIIATESFLENLHFATHLGSFIYFVGQGNLATNKQAAQPNKYMKISTKMIATISTPVILVNASLATPSQKTDQTRHNRAKLLIIENLHFAAKYFTRAENR